MARINAKGVDNCIMERSDICRYLYSLGLSPKHKGFNYICEVLFELCSSGDPLYGFNAAFMKVCTAHGIERHAAERCMRYAVGYAWDAPDGALRRLFCCGEPQERSHFTPPPSLSEFLHIVLWRLEDRR